MNKTKIEWCDYTWNPIKGYCPNNCPYCYAHRMYNRFGWDKTIRLDEKELCGRIYTLIGKKIFVGSMIEMYHPEIPSEWLNKIINKTIYSRNIFITLTKFPENLYQFNFPSNWWLGVTLDRFDKEVVYYHHGTMPNRINFISFEPLLSDMYSVSLQYIDWIIIGGLTPKPVHQKEWIDDIVERADNLKIPVFIKDNAHYPIKRQEFPDAKK